MTDQVKYRNEYLLVRSAAESERFVVQFLNNNAKFER